MLKAISQVLVLMLAAIAAIVAWMQREAMWWVICLYWVVLTIKNAVDFSGGCMERRKKGR